MLSLINDVLDLNENQQSVFQAALAAPDFFYRKFTIPKKRGGIREISAPYPFLAQIQRAVFETYLSQCVFPDFVCAYVPERSALTHASFHLGTRELLKLDIKDFFPSINRQSIHEVFERLGCSSTEAAALSSICTLNDKLPQGASTSPILSNLVFLKLDRRLNRLARSFELKYSRYADDLVFSGDFVPRGLARTVERIISEGGFELNMAKTQLKITPGKRIVTGVSIATGTAKAPKEFKRKLRAQIHCLEKAEGNISMLDNFDPLAYERALGRLNYLLQVEPGNKYALNKKKSLSRAHQAFLSKGHKFLASVV